ncbi:Uncharacterized protein Adt_34684 [Abeliophyllum distichum]|uniref:EF-hand domain-containing protein n=1 Tax=Abeliophyllum distichum TaxID=126358 RepID=A0ABD1R1S6_9LAMI
MFNCQNVHIGCSFQLKINLGGSISISWFPYGEGCIVWLQHITLGLWTGYGVVIELGTSHTAWIMLASVIPLMMIQIPRIFQLSYLGERIVILIILLVSAIFLNHTMGRLLTDNGSLNVSAIRRLFEETDRDGDKFISFTELKEFLQGVVPDVTDSLIWGY